ncbi:MAG: hypothetical protein NVS2B12_08240 [Ktedonobacteraceae bacterium]
MNFCTPAGLSSLGTSLGLAQTTGYSPYMPLLALAAATKWFHLCHLNPFFNFITNDWFIATVAILTVVDLIVDLFPVISSGWHTLHTTIVPLIGGFITAATVTDGNVIPGIQVTAFLAESHLSALSSPGILSSTGQLHLSGPAFTVLMFVVGFLLAGMVHIHRFGGRVMAHGVHAFTLGLSNTVISVVEDIVAVIAILLSFFAPLIMFVIVVIVVVFVLLTFSTIMRGFSFIRRRLT